MKNHTSRKVLFTSLSIVLFTLLSSIIINLLTGSEEINLWLKANGVGTTKLVIGAIAISITLLLLTYLQISRSQSPEPTTENIETDVKRLFDSLKERYQNRYLSKLDRRFEITLEVSENWNSDRPKTYKFGAEAKISYAVGAIRKAFYEKGRLLIVGSPGSGKTVLLLKLALALLGNECQAGHRLPIIFNLASWSEEYTKFENWLVDVLNSGNGLSKDFARTLLQENRIVFLLDGLDELARNEETTAANVKRAKCLEAIYGYAEVRHQFVICCRREEFVQMQRIANQDELLPAKVEILDLTKLDIEVALAEAQRADGHDRAAAERLESIIETNEAFLDVLSTPFYFTTALEVVDKSPLKAKEFPKDAEEIKKYLLDKFIAGKISHTPKLTGFEKDKAKIKRWLHWLATLMEKRQLVTFELANLQSSDLPRKSSSNLIIGSLVGFFFSFWFGLWNALFHILFRGIVTVQSCITYNEFGEKCLRWLFFLIGDDLFKAVLGGLLMGFFAGFILSRYKLFNSIDTSTEYLNRSDFFGVLKETVRFVVSPSLAFWLLGSILFGLLLSVWYGLLSGLIIGFVIGVYTAFTDAYDSILSRLKEINRVEYIQYAYQKINNGLVLHLTLSLMLLFVSVCLAAALAIKDFFVVTLVLPYHVFISSIPFKKRIRIRLYDHFILRFCLYIDGAMPLKYATFLDYAAEARILEKDGGQWRFRHQNLQEYFVKLGEH